VKNQGVKNQDAYQGPQAGKIYCIITAKYLRRDQTIIINDVHLTGWKISLVVIAVCMILSGCSSVSASGTDYRTPTLSPQPLQASQEATTLQSLAVEINPTPSITPRSKKSVSIWADATIPEVLSKSLVFPQEIHLVSQAESADLWISPIDTGQVSRILGISNWVYILTAPFPTVTDNISIKDLLNIWKMGGQDEYKGYKILVTQNTRDLFFEKWGKPNSGSVIKAEREDLLGLAWENPNTFAIIPFDELQPRWKIIKVDGVIPMDKDVNMDTYPLTIEIGLVDLSGQLDENLVSQLNQLMPRSNFDPQKMTSVIMTGTTAMVRYLALRMEEKGVAYPGGEIRELLSGADITHISNEVSFDPNCPPAKPLRREARFCSDPKYLGLLQDVGTDIIELTGNHNLDWGYNPYIYSLDLYKREGLRYYGGGVNATEANQPLLIEHNGNKLAFIGCSPAGPENVWATKDLPGSAKCDFVAINNQIKKLREEGYLPIFTFQHYEVDDFKPHSSQRIDFQKVAAMGAEIVSGSQSHFAQTFTFIDNHFVHYGLGNLFFDQMFEINRPAFIDQHFFYNGRYVNTRLFTTLLEDYSRPRFMTEGERRSFLDTVFNLCVWQ
jgi:hypothetical protein